MTKTLNPDEIGVAPARSFPLHSIFTHPFGKSRPVYDAPVETTTTTTDPVTPPATTTTTTDPVTPPAAEPGKKITDDEAKLLKDAMKHKTRASELQAQLAAFGSVTAEEVQQMLAERQAAAEKKSADELAAAEARGEFDRVKQSMNEQQAAALEAERAKIAAKDTELSAAQATISELTVGAAFANSTFIRNDLVMPPAKARTVYGAHFDTVGTQVVGYNLPRGAEGRTPLVDAAGKNLPFEAAIAKLIDSDPDKDSLLRSKMAPGAGSKTIDSTNTKHQNGTDTAELKGAARIRASLAAMKAAASA